ncbi:glycoside hydrolase family 3 C-terminal domain-containing protein [Antribacter gilvus]|uniref:glycoside hydrolase family 3 C-terminal domain-containing protein n=1 Tax=Antribacter gilvus TaxID=2304675 RepID=UPI00197EC85A|nr:glycoside hydrolase family 3 C-terminal domain-containing protein [Antribacter gilvus]
MTTTPPASDLTLDERVSLLSGSGSWLTQPLPDHDVPAVVLSDGPHGLRYQRGAGDHLGIGRSEPATCFPPAVTLASSWDEDLAAEVGRAVGAEARALGVGVVLGPGLNIKRHPLCGRNFEYLSEDPVVSGRMAAALTEGIQSQGVGACLKHFAANNQESHRFVVDVVVDERTLREIYLAGFEHAVRHARPWTVMASYNLLDGLHTTEHPGLLTQILRDEWGFHGLVMSDWAAVHDRAAGVAAGLDLEMPGSRGLFDAEVHEAVRTGALAEGAVTTSAQRVLDLVARAPQPDDAPGVVPDHLREADDALARRAAAAGTVLLRNDGLLPLAPGTRLAVVGAFAEEPRYQGAGSSQVNPTRVTSALDELRARGVEVTYARGYDPARSADDAALLAEAIDVAAAADVAVVLVGLPAVRESEGFDREDLALPAQHDALVTAVAAVNPRTVVALSNGGPVLLPWRDRVAAILESYLGGQAGGAALVDVLFGDAEPGGRLAETFPARQEDVASDPWFPGHPHMVEHREGLMVGYRHHVTSGIEPAYPFGFGLGYTTFAWDGAALDREILTPGDGATVTVTVTNTGGRAGSDVVQVYVHDATGVVLRPRRELAGFAKVHLAPGESREVQVRVPARAFAFYDAGAPGWRTPVGRFEVEVARSSADVVATLPVEVEGGVTSAPEPADAEPVARTDEAFARRLGRPVPTPRPVRPFTRDSLVGEVAARTRLGALLQRAIVRRTPVDESDDEATRLMYERSTRELPLRAAAIFSQGAIDLPTLDALIAAMNGKPADAAKHAGAAVAGRARVLGAAVRARLGRPE